MKKNLFLFIALFAGVFTLFAQQVNEDGIRLYHTPSQEEIDWAKSKGLVTEPKTVVPPPAGEIRPIAEFEPMEAVLIRYPLGIPYSLIKEMAKDIKVITVVSNSNHQTAINNYTSNGVNMANCQFLIANSDSYWTRDYGPWFMAIDNQNVGMFDFTYNRPARPNDNQVNGQLVTFLTNDGIKPINRYVSPLQLTGGNFMNDGISQAASTTLTLNENYGYTTQQIKDHFMEYMGIEQYHFIADPINPYDNIQHIDCWSKLLAPDKVLVAKVPAGSLYYDKFETAANYFASLTSSWGTPMQVFRVNEGAINGSLRTPYTNSLILNNKVFVPTTGNAYDADALQVYQDAMPGYEIIGISDASLGGYDKWINTDALHCRTHEIADRCMLYIKHQPLFGEIENTGTVTFTAELYSYCNNTITYDSVYIRTAGSEYVGYNMEFAGENIWETTVSGLPGGLIEYYIVAKDASERRECHPYIGAPDPHKFTLIGDPTPLPILSVNKTNSSVTSNGLAVIEDHITVYNVGNADLTFEITDIDFIEKLSIAPLDATVLPGDSIKITLSYDFNGVENGEYEGSFNILSNDPLHQNTEITLHASQNYTPPVPVLVIDITSSSVVSDGLEIIEDMITISNEGNADLEFEITAIDFPEWLTITPLESIVQPDGSQVITLSYDFSNVKLGEYSGSFIILSNDLLNLEIPISLSAIQNYVGIKEGNVSPISIYPNPANDKINIVFNKDNSTKANIYNILGVQLKEIALSKGLNTIDIKDFPKSIYFIKIDGVVIKLVKQ
ncbi:MAG: agmatine deiminase family protein [Bacteroidales bacterium]|jgi:agmatine/peptidylarginine deiminase|nr:agmatine deiminase family protein [Bacteroidales bacterium]